MIEPGLYRNVHEDDLNIWTASFSRVLDSVKTDELMIVLSVCDGDQQSSVVVATRTGVVGHVVMDVWEYFVERVEL